MKNKWTDFLGKTWEFDDMGIAISNGTLIPPGGILYDGKYLVINQDPAVPIPGFMIITLKRHTNSFSLLTKEEKIEMDLNISKEFTIVQEDRCSHYHIWIFPDDNWLSDNFPRGIEKMRELFKVSKEKASKEIIEETLDITKKIKLQLDECKKIYGEKLFRKVI